MKHTLMPNTELKYLQKEYRIRATIVLLFLISVSFLIGVGSLLPAYIRAKMDEKLALDIISSIKKSADARGVVAIEEELQQDQKLISILSASTDRTKISSVFENIIMVKGKTRISSLSATEPSTTTVSVIIQGTAPTRESLLTFKTDLESLRLGNTVELPVSALTKSTDIQFSIRLLYILP